MNPDTAPIAEVEAWLAPRLGWINHCGKWSAPDGNGEYSRPIIGPSMDAAIAEDVLVIFKVWETGEEMLTYKTICERVRAKYGKGKR